MANYTYATNVSRESILSDWRADYNRASGTALTNAQFLKQILIERQLDAHQRKMDGARKTRVAEAFRNAPESQRKSVESSLGI